MIIGASLAPIPPSRQMSHSGEFCFVAGRVTICIAMFLLSTNESGLQAVRLLIALIGGDV